MQRLLFVCIVLLASLAQAAPAAVATHYDIALTLQDAKETFAAAVTIDVHVQARSRRTLTLHSKGLRYESVLVDGEAAQFEQRKDTLKIQMHEPVLRGEVLSLELQYSGSFHASGLQRVTHTGAQLYMAGVAGYEPSRLFPCFDIEENQASIDLSVWTDPQYLAIAPGELVRENLQGKESPQRFAQYHLEYPQPLTALSLVVGKFTRIRSEVRSSNEALVPITLYVEPEQQHDLGVALYALRESLTYFEELFDEPFPFSNLRLLASPVAGSFPQFAAGLISAPASLVAWSPLVPELYKVRVAAELARVLAWQWLRGPQSDPKWGEGWVRAGLADYLSDVFVEYIFTHRLFDFFAVDHGIENKTPRLHKRYSSERARAVFAAIAAALGEERWHAVLHDFVARIPDHPARVLAGDHDWNMLPESYVMPLSALLAQYDVSLVQDVKRWARGGKEVPQSPVATIERDDVHHVLTGELSERTQIHQLKQLLQSDRTAATAQQVLQLALEHGAKPVQLAVFAELLESGYRAQALRHIVGQSGDDIVRMLRGRPQSLVDAQLRRVALELLGVTDDPGYYALLRSRLNYPVVDVQLGAIAGLLHTSDAERFAVVESILAALPNNDPRRSIILHVVARVDDVQSIGMLRKFVSPSEEYINDVLSTLILHNRLIAFTPAGLNLLRDWAARHEDLQHTIRKLRKSSLLNSRQRAQLKSLL